jgi:hypothetical protein
MLAERNRFYMKLQFFSEEIGDTGVDSTPAAEEPATEGETSTESTESTETTEETKEPEKQNNFEKAFAKRLAAERQKWEDETKSKFQNYDEYKTVAEFIQEQGQFKDILSAKEAVELERLQARAEKQNVSPEVQRRIEELESKAAKAEEYEKQQEQNKQFQEFRTKLDGFAKEKDVNPDDLHKFMYDNQIANMEVAYKAMKFEDAAAQREQIEKEAVKKYLESKKGPKVEAGGTAGVTNAEPAKSWAEARQRAAERFRAMNNQ